MASALSRRIPSPLPLLSGLLAAYLIAPLVAGALQSPSARWHSVQLPALLHACGVSLATATAATFLVALGGVPLGYVLARLPGRAMAVLGFLVQLPLALPPLASGVLLLFLVGYDTPLGRLTGGALTDSFAGIVLAEAFVAAPFVIIASRSAFAAIDPALEGVAQTLGRRPLEVFWRVSLPVAWPALLSGLLLAWLRAFGEFGATVMVAYHPYSLPVYTYVAFGAQGLPAMLPVLLPALSLALVVMAVSSRVGNARRTVASGRAAGARGPASPPASALPLAVGSGGPASSDSQLSLSLRKRLNGFELAVEWSPGARRLAVLGPSGSGKSLTLKLIAGLERPDSGTIRLGDRDVSGCPPAARAVGYVPQSYGLFPHLTLLEQLCFPVGAQAERAARWIGRSDSSSGWLWRGP
jgi:ABC-type sulfate transport system permease component